MRRNARAKAESSPHDRAWSPRARAVGGSLNAADLSVIERNLAAFVLELVAAERELSEGAGSESKAGGVGNTPPPKGNSDD